MSHRIYIENNGAGEWIEGQWIRGELWVHFRGETRKLESETKSFGNAGGARAKENISAPMPGKVTKLLCESGQRVKAGDVLVVMEAMKMEYSLKTDVDGEVQKIECQAGDQVSLGKVLVRMKKVPLAP